jgi:hypothetical protein
VQALHAQQTVRPKDADGDNDGDKSAAPKAGSLPLATFASLGTHVNAMA